MTPKRRLDLLFVLLLTLTLLGAALGERAASGSTLLLLVVATMAVKGRLVIDYFMELRSAHPLLRGAMRAYYYVIPLITVVVYLFGERLVRFVTI